MLNLEEACVCLVTGLLVGGGGVWVVVYFSMDNVLKKSISRLSPHSHMPTS